MGCRTRTVFEQGLVEFRRPLDGMLHGIELRHAALRRSSELSRVLWRFEQPANRIGKGTAIARSDQQSILTVLYHLGRSPNACGDNRRGRGHRLEQGVGKTLAERRQNQDRELRRASL